MAKFSIKSADGLATRYEGKPKYNGIFGKPSFLEFAEISSPSPIGFSVGDYVDYSRTGFRYYLYSIPQPLKQARTNTSGDAYVYKNVQFFCKTKDLEIAPFRDLVLNGATHFTTLSSVSTYEDVFGIANRIQACMDDFCGAGVWNIVCYEEDADVVAKMREMREFSLNDGSVLDALNQIYNQWLGIGWIYSCPNGVHTITIGRPNVQDADNTTDVFLYGKGNGLKAIAKNISSHNDFATRVFVYGSTRNMPTRWYNNQSIYDSGAVYIPNLMIPLRFWGKTGGLSDARKAYLENAALTDIFGLRVKTIRFDGTGDYEEIYPSIEKMTFEELRDAHPEYTPSAIYDDSDRVDEIKSAINPSDNGIIDTDGGKYKEELNPTISGTTKSLTLNPGQKSFSVSIGSIALGTLQNTGLLELDLSGVEFSIADIGQYPTSIKATLVVQVGDNVVFITNPDVTMGEDVTCTLSKYRINISIAGTLKFSFIVDADILNVGSAVTTEMEMSVSQGVIAGISSRIASTFSLTLKQIGFDISKQYTSDGQGYGTIEMKTGECAGRAFVVSKVKYQAQTDDWLLTLQRQSDSSLGQVFPNNQYRIFGGDRFVITGIMMPDLYVNAAAERLYLRGMEVFNLLNKPKMVYSPEVDSKVIAESGERLCEGMYMMVRDEDIIGVADAFVLISSLTISEEEDAIPIYSVTLRDEKATSVFDKISGEAGRTAKRLLGIETKEEKSPFDEQGESDDNISTPAVQILCDKPFFTFASGSQTPIESAITLTCDTKGIVVNSLRWEYWDENTSAWIAISGANKQIYNVVPDGEYFPSGDNVAKIRCSINSGEYSADITIVKMIGGLDGQTVLLSSQSLLFEGNDTHALASTVTVDVVAYRRQERLITNIGTITGGITGKISATKVNDGTISAKITVTITNTCDVAGGFFIIPVTAGGVTTDLRLGWGVLFKGKDAAPVEVQYSLDGAEWHTTYQTGDIYMRMFTEGSWGNAVRIKGENGADGADGVDGADGTSIEWQGTFASHPANPQNGWAYYNSTTKKTYTYRSGSWYQMSQDGVDGANGKDGNDGLSIVWKGDMVNPPANPEKNWAYRDIDNGRCYIYNGIAWALMVHDGQDGVDGAKGDKGDDGNTPYIQNGYWYIAGISTGIKAEGVDGRNGTDGKDGTNGTDGKDGADGLTPYIGQNRHWFIGTTDTGVVAQGENGNTPTIGANGNWWIGGQDTGKPSAGDDGKSPYVSTVTGTWWEYNASTQSYEDTGIQAEGQDGADGLSVYITYHNNPATSTPETPTGAGTTGGWHTNPTADSVWISQKVASSSSSGIWGSPIRIKGEDGQPGADGEKAPYHDFSFGISAYASASGTPSDITTWADTPPAITQSKPYLWCRDRYYIVDEHNEWVLSSTKYMRLTGEKGADGASPACPYRGEYDSGTLYYGTPFRRDIVKRGGLYYIAKTDAGYGFNEVPPSGKWEEFGAQYESVATRLFLADTATIQNLTVDKVKTNEYGERIVIDDNQMTMYDANDNVKMKISGDNLASIPSSITIQVPSVSVLNGYDSPPFYREGTATLVGSMVVQSGSANKVSIPSMGLEYSVYPAQSLAFGVSIRFDVIVGGNIVQTKYHNESWNNDDHIAEGTITTDEVITSLTPGTYAVMVKCTITASGDSGTVEFYTSSDSYGNITISYGSQAVEVGANGFRAMFSGNHVFQAVEENGAIELVMRAGNYGIKVTNTGMQKMTNGIWQQWNP